MKLIKKIIVSFMVAAVFIGIMDDEWFSLECSLDTHVSYDSNYNSIVDYSDLK